MKIKNEISISVRRENVTFATGRIIIVKAVISLVAVMNIIRDSLIFEVIVKKWYGYGHISRTSCTSPAIL